jgi:YidC/Oxa1 family membrane protein insertase
MQDDNNKNLILAVILSVLVLLGWQLFFVNPKIKDEQERRAQQEKSQPATAQPGTAAPAPGTTAPGTAAAPGTPPAVTQQPQVALTREQALAASPRVAIETANLRGSINLKGGRIDDLALAKYREEANLKSPNVVVLAPSQSQSAYFTEFGWLTPQGTTIKAPDSATVWTNEGGNSLTATTPVRLRWDNGAGQVFRRVFSLDATYMFTIEDSVQHAGETPLVLNHHATIARQGTPKVEGFYILHEGLVGVAAEKLHEIGYSELLKNLRDGEQHTRTFEKVKGSWFGITDKYWATTLIPDANATPDLLVTGYAKPPGPNTKEAYQVNYLTAATVAPRATHTVSTRLFAGAKEVHTIEAYQANLGIAKFDLMVDWGWFYFVTKPMFQVIDWLARLFGSWGLVGNFGLAILATTVLVKIAFFWLANKSYESMAKMKKLQPEMERIRERYKDDRARQQQEMMEMYKKEKINPMAGCLPIVIQIPVFFALYKVLFISLDMRHAPFYGWIKDLSAADPTTLFNLFGLLPFDPTLIPVIGSFLHVGAWPIIMGLTMFIQMQLNPQQPDPVQQKIFNLMPLIFTFMLATFPVGLVIYWAWNNILSLIQQYAINKKHGAEVHLWKNLGLEKLQKLIESRRAKSGNS